MEKKSERLEVRLGHQEKQNFTQACDLQGDTPSGAIRRFITGYIKRSDADLFSAFLRTARHKIWIGSGLALGLIAAGFIFADQFKPQPTYDGDELDLIAATNAYPQEGITKPIGIDPNDIGPDLQSDHFERWDKDGDGILRLGEILPNDHHLHLVLDVDGVSGISLAEFWAKGRMHYREVKKVKISDTPTSVNFSYDEKDATPEKVVDFDLTRSRPKIAVYIVTGDTNFVTPDRALIWKYGQSKPFGNISLHDYRQRNINP